jgi:hypothetical protein
MWPEMAHCEGLFSPTTQKKDARADVGRLPSARAGLETCNPATGASHQSTFVVANARSTPTTIGRSPFAFT